MAKRFNILLAITFSLYIILFFFLHIFIPSKKFSEMENRQLEPFPSFSLDSFVSGEYGKKMERYIADQFPLRDKWISVKSNTELALGKRENKGVFIGKNHYFLQDFKPPSEEIRKKNVDYINSLANTYNVTLMLAPTATKIFEEKLPPFATPYDESVYINAVRKNLSKQVTFIPLLEPLTAKKDEYLYYKTDHHWTTLGAYYAYLSYCKEKGLSASSFEQIEVTNSFYGTLYSKGNFTFAEPDSISLYKPNKAESVDVTYLETERKTNTLYELNNLDKKDKYSIFLDGNHPHITIKTSQKNGKKLMIIKDSYANSFVPFLTAHYEEIHILDYRFLNVPLSSIMDEYNLNEVLLLYNVQNFSQERKFSLLR